MPDRPERHDHDLVRWSKFSSQRNLTADRRAAEEVRTTPNHCHVASSDDHVESRSSHGVAAEFGSMGVKAPPMAALRCSELTRPPAQPRHCARPFGPCSVAPGRTAHALDEASVRLSRAPDQASGDSSTFVR